ncbi:hypothetical protein [Polyangium fumosum]|uniref:Uncharacterized protein n=1 Tax=Polyangium fumosum TaxID=889272 RepID=A0A4U1IV38_9BACT|nr:hypothetical protein [Polyangium fumosum]TKC97971.1 hypothetical protein E8A74_43040 [Polyangium fumosum]
MRISTSPLRFSRTEKATIGRKLHENLLLRAEHGPPEPALDAFVPLLDVVAARLSAHVTGKVETSAARAAHANHVEEADVEVDSCARHIEGFLYIEAHRRRGPYVTSARALHAAAFPTGRSFLDDHIPEQNAQVRGILTVLRAPEHAATLVGIAFPMEWLDRLASAVAASDAAFAERAAARGSLGKHVSLGRDAEAAWADVVGRLRKYVASRAAAGDVERESEGRALLAPLTDAIAHAKALAAARATRRGKKATTETDAASTTG